MAKEKVSNKNEISNMENKSKEKISTNNKKAAMTAQLEENKVSTDYDKSRLNNYIKFSINNLSGENDAPDAQLEEQRSNKSCLHRYPSSILGWGALSFSNNKMMINEVKGK